MPPAQVRAKITDNVEVLLEFYNYPGEHCRLRIESTFATVRLHQCVTKGPGSRAAGVAMGTPRCPSARPARPTEQVSAHLISESRYAGLIQRSQHVGHRHRAADAGISTSASVGPRGRAGRTSAPSPSSSTIRTFIDGWNDRCEPFTWTKDADTILAKANRK
jgi:hypothetical protein